MRFLRYLAKVVTNQVHILKELHIMAVQFDALSTAVDNAVAKLASAASDKAAIQTQLDQAHADLVAAQAKVDELTAKLSV